MSQGTTVHMRRKLSELRGENAKKAEEARILAETAILQARKDEALKQDIHVPLILNEDVAKLMKDNELENATIIFSKNAINLFAGLFAQAMGSAVKDAMMNVQEVVEKVVERKLLETVMTASDSMSKMLQAMLPGVIPEPKNEELPKEKEPVVHQATEPKPQPSVVAPHIRKMSDEAKAKFREQHKLSDDIEVVGNAKTDLERTTPFLLRAFEASAGESVRLAEVCRLVQDDYKVVWMNPNHTINYLMKVNESVKRVGFGLYKYDS